MMFQKLLNLFRKKPAPEKEAVVINTKPTERKDPRVSGVRVPTPPKLKSVPAARPAARDRSEPAQDTSARDLAISLMDTVDSSPSTRSYDSCSSGSSSSYDSGSSCSSSSGD